MWLCAGDDVTSNSEIKQFDPTGHLVQGHANLPVTGADVCISDDTDSATAGIRGGPEGAFLRATGVMVLGFGKRERRAAYIRVEKIYGKMIRIYLSGRQEKGMG